MTDRLDLRIQVPRLEVEDIVGPEGEASVAVRSRVAGARARQARRGVLNRELQRPALDAMNWHAEAAELLRRAVTTLQLTGRGWDRVRRVARTIADLEDSPSIGAPHVAEALAMRGSP